MFTRIAVSLAHVLSRLWLDGTHSFIIHTYNGGPLLSSGRFQDSMSNYIIHTVARRC